MRRVGTIVMLFGVLWLFPHPLVRQASSQPPSARYTPLVLGWERFFTVTSDTFQRNGRPYVSGTVVNDWGFSARRIQLLIDGLDSSGQIVSQSVTWLGQALTPGSRAYFEVPAPQPAASYRVRIFAYDWLQSASIEAP